MVRRRRSGSTRRIKRRRRWGWRRRSRGTCGEEVEGEGVRPRRRSTTQP